MWLNCLLAFLMYDYASAVFLPDFSVILPDKVSKRAQKYNQNAMISSSQCKPLTECFQLVWLLKNRQNFSALESEQILDYIKGIQCGFEVKEPKIFCPKYDEAIEDDGINFNATNRIVIDTPDVVSP